MVLASPGTLLTPPPSSSPPKTPIWSYSAQTPPRNGNPNAPDTVPAWRPLRPQTGTGLTGGQNWPQADTDAMQHPRHSSTVLSLSSDDTTANQMTTSHLWSARTGRESHYCKVNYDEGSPRLQSKRRRKKHHHPPPTNTCCCCTKAGHRCVFIAAVPIIKLFVRGEGDSGGHVLMCYSYERLRAEDCVD